MRISQFMVAATLSVSALAFPTHANAFDSKAFVEQLETLIEADGAKVSYGAVEQSGNTLLINKFVIENEKLETKSTVETLTFTNPEQSSDGEFSYESLNADNIVHTGRNETKVEIETISSQGLEFSGNETNDPLPLKVGALEISDITFSTSANGNNGKLTIPSISAKGFLRTSTRNFKLEDARVAPFQGRMFNNEGTPTDISFSGASVSDFEHFGTYGFDIGSLDLGSFTLNTTSKLGPVSATMGGMAFENYYAWDPADETRSLIPDDDIKITIEPLDISVAGKTLLSMEQSGGEAINDALALTSKSQFALNKLKVDFAALPDTPENRATLQQVRDLGYDSISMDIAIKADSNLKTGIIDINEFKFDFLDAGSMDLKMNVSGYTEQVAKSIAAALAKMQDGSNDPQAQQVQMLQLMAMFAPLSLQTMEMEVTDASLLKKVLGLQARKRNRSAEELGAIIPPMASIAMAPLQVPELASSISAALGVFMQGNKSISVTISPDGGLALTEMIALGSGVQAGSTTPADLVNRLNLKVEAR